MLDRGNRGCIVVKGHKAWGHMGRIGQYGSRKGGSPDRVPVPDPGGHRREGKGIGILITIYTNLEG